MASPIQPFEIAVPDAALAELKSKLEHAKLPPASSFSEDRAYGVRLSDLKRLVEYWKDGFDWRAQEAKINRELPQFTTTVSVEGFGDLKIHFVHKKSSNPDSIPLLFSHGWPGSFLEIQKILPFLVENKDGGPTFHVVAPSLPNFGFSDGVSKPGFGIPQYAEAMHKVMIQLGYDKYVTQGGDWGYMVTRLMGAQYPKHCLASHLNFVPAWGEPSFFKHPLLYLQSWIAPYSTSEKAGLDRTKWFTKEGTGYNQEQSTKPATLGFALTDSPVALLAWIYEKLIDWTDNYPWTDDEALTWISIYQFSTAGPGASSNIYYERAHAMKDKTKKASEYNPAVKLGFSYFPKDLVVLPKYKGKTLGPVVFETEHPDGGHFAAHERPEVLAADLKKMFGKKGGAGDIGKYFASRSGSKL